MRFKVILRINKEVFGNVLPISYQYELCAAINNMLTQNNPYYINWLAANNLTTTDNVDQKLYSISNLYVPHIFVHEDRMSIQVPKIQFWISFLHDIDTAEFVMNSLINQQITIGDRKSRVNFTFENVEIVSPICYSEVMEYQTISPICVLAMRENRTIEFLEPENPYFAQFMVDELIEKWSRLNHRSYEGSRDYQFTILTPIKRKAVTIKSGTPMQKKVIAYMVKFRLTMDPMLQEIAYCLGVGDKNHQGFGYIELLYKGTE